jgi:hypothetical protein
MEHYKSKDFVLLYGNVTALISRIEFCVISETNETSIHYNFCYVQQVVLYSLLHKNKIYFHMNKANTDTVESVLVSKTL